jgi:hypothetical protein
VRIRAGGRAFVQADIERPTYRPDDRGGGRRVAGLDGIVLNVGIVSRSRARRRQGRGRGQPRHLRPRSAAGKPPSCEGFDRLHLSIAALGAGSRIPAYDASKAALGGLMRHVAMEGCRRGIRANIVYPGLVDTPLGRAATAGRPSRAATQVPLGRQATAWEVAYAVLFFLSDESVYVTAQGLAIDGGLSGI